MKSQWEDQIWMTRIALVGDEKAFEQIVGRYQQRVRRFFLAVSGDPELSDDLAQETFIRVWRRAGSFRHLSAFSTWLYSIAINLWRDHCKRAGLAAELWDDSFYADGGKEPPALIDDTDGGDLIERRERDDIVRRAVARLSPTERTCITLFYLEELSVRDVSRATGMSISAVKVALSRGRVHLKTILDHRP